MRLEWLNYKTEGKVVEWLQEDRKTLKGRYWFAPFGDVPEELGVKLLKTGEYREVAIIEPPKPIEYRCEVCDVVFKNATALSAHKRFKHKEIRHEEVSSIDSGSGADATGVGADECDSSRAE